MPFSLVPTLALLASLSVGDAPPASDAPAALPCDAQVLDWLEQNLPQEALMGSGWMEALAAPNACALRVTQTTPSSMNPSQLFQLNVQLASEEMDPTKVTLVSVGSRASVTLYARQGSGFPMMRREGDCGEDGCHWGPEYSDTSDRFDLAFSDEVMAQRIAAAFRTLAALLSPRTE